MAENAVAGPIQKVRGSCPQDLMSLCTPKSGFETQYCPSFMLTAAANRKKKVFSPLRAARRQKGPIHNKLVLTLPHPHLQPSYQPWVGQKR